MGEARFGRYRLERLLGRGGMGQVWLAYDTEAERNIALKLLPAEFAADAVYRTRFEREAEAIAALRDPHIVPIHGYGEVDGRLYMDLELIEGDDLGRMLRADGPMAPGSVAAILDQVAGALDTAHRAGLVHRDVKPSNIVVRPDGAAYLIDFGLAHISGQTQVTATGFAMGTWGYMAPERFAGKTEPRSDVYSLACVLYECLTGRRPYGDTDPAQQMHAHLVTAPPRASSLNPAVPAALDAVIACGMAKDPAARYPTAGEFARAMRAAIGPAALRQAHPPAPTTRLPHPDLPPTRVATRVAPAAPHPARTRPPAHRPVQSRPPLSATRVAPAPQRQAPAPGRPQPVPYHAQPPSQQGRQWYLRRRPAPAPVRPGRKVFPVQARPQAPAPRRRRKSKLTRVLIITTFVLLSPFLLLGGCAVLVLAGNDATPDQPTTPPGTGAPVQDTPAPALPAVTIPGLDPGASPDFPALPLPTSH